MGKRNVIKEGEKPQVCRRGKNADPNTVYLSFKTSGPKNVVIRKVVYDSFNNNFFMMGQRAAEAWKAKPAKGTRRSSVPNTVFGKALTVGAKLDAIKQYELEQAEKAAAKVQRADERLVNAQKKALQREKELQAAKSILLRYQNDRDVCSKKLLVSHLRALLICGCGVPQKQLTNKKKQDLLDIYWTNHHVDVEFEPRVGMDVSRYFGDDLYNGEVTELVGGVGTIVYEDGDSEKMDVGQMEYAHNLYIEEN